MTAPQLHLGTVRCAVCQERFTPEDGDPIDVTFRDGSTGQVHHDCYDAAGDEIVSDTSDPTVDTFHGTEDPPRFDQSAADATAGIEETPTAYEVALRVAASLTPYVLADRLMRLSSNIRWCSRIERDAYLIEAARRIDPGLRPGVSTPGPVIDPEPVEEAESVEEARYRLDHPGY